MNKGFDLSSFDAFKADVEKEARRNNLVCFTPMTEADLAAEYTVARLKTESKERMHDFLIKGVEESMRENIHFGNPNRDLKPAVKYVADKLEKDESKGEARMLIAAKAAMEEYIGKEKVQNFSDEEYKWSIPGTYEFIQGFKMRGGFPKEEIAQ